MEYSMHTSVNITSYTQIFFWKFMNEIIWRVFFYSITRNKILADISSQHKSCFGKKDKSSCTRAFKIRHFAFKDFMIESKREIFVLFLNLEASPLYEYNIHL